MHFDEYQKKTAETAGYPNVGNNHIYPTLGLVGEAGEVAEKMKKVIRDHGGIITADKRQEIGKELGDVLWYISQLCSELGLSMKDVAQGNIDKLRSRKERGVLGGEGDNR